MYGEDLDEIELSGVKYKWNIQRSQIRGECETLSILVCNADKIGNQKEWFETWIELSMKGWMNEMVENVNFINEIFGRRLNWWRYERNFDKVWDF